MNTYITIIVVRYGIYTYENVYVHSKKSGRVSCIIRAGIDLVMTSYRIGDNLFLSGTFMYHY